jgi:hypothetical protein
VNQGEPDALVYPIYPMRNTVNLVIPGLDPELGLFTEKKIRHFVIPGLARNLGPVNTCFALALLHKKARGQGAKGRI